MLIIKPGDGEDHTVPNMEIPVGVLRGIEAQAGGPVGQGAEHPAGVFAGDSGLPAAAQGMADLRPLKGVGLGLPDGDSDLPGGAVIGGEHAVQGLPGPVDLPEVPDVGVAHIPVAQGHIPAAALQQAPGRGPQRAPGR